MTKSIDLMIKNQRPINLLIIFGSIILVTACGRDEPARENSLPPRESTADLVCSYAPSQSAIVDHIASVAGGSASAAYAVAKAAGLTAVEHSSGAYIFTGANGYVAGTLGGAALMPIITVVGTIAGGTVISLELLCAQKNHPKLVKKVEAAVKEFKHRSRSVLYREKLSSSFAAEVKSIAVYGEDKAYEYANRTSISIKEALERAKRLI